jgi:AICAR transformylase/IMP cyclohydrolase PurH
MYGQIGSYVMDYVHLPDTKLRDHAENQWRNEPMDPTLRKQAVRDVKLVIKARHKGEHWAWKRTALLSAFDKTGLDDFALQLSQNGWRIMASGGTAKFLNDKGIKAWDVADIVGAPILGHRVVTLSRELHAALLAQRDKQEDEDELTRLKVPFIDLVYVNLYPLREEIARPECTLQSVIEKTDIGGPTMLRSAAKGRRLAVCRSSEFPVVLKLISGTYYKPIIDKYPRKEDRAKRDEEITALEQRIVSGLASIAECEISDYCHTSCEYHRKVAGEAFWNEIKLL